MLFSGSGEVNTVGNRPNEVQQRAPLFSARAPGRARREGGRQADWRKGGKEDTMRVDTRLRWRRSSTFREIEEEKEQKGEEGKKKRERKRKGGFNATKSADVTNSWRYNSRPFLVSNEDRVRVYYCEWRVRDASTSRSREKWHPGNFPSPHHCSRCKRTFVCRSPDFPSNPRKAVAECCHNYARTRRESFWVSFLETLGVIFTGPQGILMKGSRYLFRVFVEGFFVSWLEIAIWIRR